MPTISAERPKADRRRGVSRHCSEIKLSNLQGSRKPRPREAHRGASDINVNEGVSEKKTDDRRVAFAGSAVEHP